MTEWYEKSFGEDYLVVYKHRDFGGARKEVERMISWLGLPCRLQSAGFMLWDGTSFTGACGSRVRGNWSRFIRGIAA